ncbi:hypothetical protein V9T40_007038 [Parthenolecanium corni]|uniref:SHSP domain-containing protein n=1 Tax=Parthenolecanium corni TaxID=536013 RepID=A0AAN9YBR9_9HEMI
MSLSAAKEPDEEAAADWPSVSDEHYIFSYGRALEPKFSNPSIAGYYRPWRFIDKKRSGVSRVFYARSREFRIALDVSQFAHDDVVVKLAGDKIVIEAQHPTMSDYLGRISRELVRKYKTPPDLKLNTITGKYKRGFLILWADRDFEPAEKPEISMLDEKDRDDDDDDESMVKRNVSDVEQLKEVASAKAEFQNVLGLDAATRSSAAGRGAEVTNRVAGNEEVIIRIRKSSSPISSSSV